MVEFNKWYENELKKGAYWRSEQDVVGHLLNEACLYGHLNVVAWCFENFPHLNMTEFATGMYFAGSEYYDGLLRTACQRGHAEIFEFIVNALGITKEQVLDKYFGTSLSVEDDAVMHLLIEKYKITRESLGIERMNKEIQNILLRCYNIKKIKWFLEEFNVTDGEMDIQLFDGLLSYGAKVGAQVYLDRFPEFFKTYILDAEHFQLWCNHWESGMIKWALRNFGSNHTPIRNAGCAKEVEELRLEVEEEMRKEQEDKDEEDMIMVKPGVSYDH